MVAMIQRPGDFGQSDAADTQARSCNAGEMTELHYIQPAGHFVIPSYTHVVVSERRRTVYVSGQIAPTAKETLSALATRRPDRAGLQEPARRAHCRRSDLC